MGNYIFYILIWILSLNTNEIPKLVNKEKKCTDCHLGYVDKEVVHAPAADDCLTCHESNGSKHPKKDVIGFKLTEQVPTLCNNCHEPFVKKSIHPPAEAGECLTCHSPHSSNNHALIKEDRTEKVCTECHDSPTPPNEKKHQPVSDGKCESCHDPHQSDNLSFLKSSVPDLCFTCHEKTKELQSADNIHPPFYEECFACHKPHSSAENKLLTQKLPNLCYDCHDGVKEKIEKSKYVHGIINGKKSCVGCHSPHGSGFGRFLFAEGKDLCLKCHNKTIKTENGKIANIKSMLKETNTIHPVIEEGCVICHAPHAAEYPNLLNGSFPQGSYVEADVANFALCFDCHDSELLTKDSTTSTNFRDGKENLHFIHISGKKARNCNVCHNVHGSVNEHLINEKTPFGSWEMPLRVKFHENGGKCNTGCHADKHYDRVKPGNIVDYTEQKNTNVDTDIKEVVEKNDDNIDFSIADYSKDDKITDENVKSDTVEENTNNTDDASVLDEITDNNNDDIELSSDIIKLNSIKFDFDTTKISNDIERDLTNVVNQMKKNPNFKVEIEGYTDNAGDEEYNKALSQQRANSVRNLLIKRGISGDRITTAGYGEANPITTNDTKKGRLMNRRVEFVFYLK